jgi:hypothetical protein
VLPSSFHDFVPTAEGRSSHRRPLLMGWMVTPAWAPWGVTDCTQEALETALAALRQLPGNRGVRARVTSLVHRMVDCMAVRSFPVLPAALPLLLASPEVRELGLGLPCVDVDSLVDYCR